MSTSIEPAPITRADLMSWGKVVAIVVPILIAIVTAAAKLSSDATALRKDVDVLQVTVAEHAQLLGAYREMAPRLARVSDELSKMTAALDATRIAQTALDEKLRAFDSRANQFWSVTWPTWEARWKRIEDKLDRGR